MFYGLYMKFIQLHYSKRISRCHFTLFYGRRNEWHVYIVRTCQLYHRFGWDFISVLNSYIINEIKG